MVFLFPYSKRKRISFLSLILIISIVSTLVLGGCTSKTNKNQDKEFQKFTKQLFHSQIASNSISLHYSLKNPENYGISDSKVTFGLFLTDTDVAKASAENLQKALARFSYEALSRENQVTYSVLEKTFENAEADSDYLLYEEPMGLVSGIQTQLPVLLSEYVFYGVEDVDTYLELLKTVPDYFDSLMEFEKKKSAAGLFMSDGAADTVIAQCTAFMEMGESNYLISTFVDRLKTVGISKEEQSSYIKKNAQLLQSYVLPSYNQLIAGIQDLKGTGKNAEGLCHLPKGKEYYEQVVAEATGSGRSISELKELTKGQIITDLEAMERALGTITEKEKGSADADESKGTEDSGTEEDVETAAVFVEQVSVEASAMLMGTDPTVILSELEGKIKTAFPKPPETSVQIKYVPKALEAHLSPAFYMIPAIDNTSENVIYVNQSHMNSPLTLYTTLAHEGYPGHLYQTIYFAGTNPDPVRSILNFPGYVEGWATYAEMCSYYFSSLSKEQATLLQKNSSIMLGLYTLADMGIHYDGWSRMDTVSFFKNYGIRDADTVGRIYNLILGSPGNYLKYYIGYVEFLELKKEWVEKKGENFSQKEFHQAVLSVGPADFETVEKYMREGK